MSDEIFFKIMQKIDSFEKATDAKFDHIDSKFDRIDSKLDRIEQTLSVQERTLQVQSEQLKEHIRRTNLLEERVEQGRREMLPVEQHVEFVNRLGKLILFLAGLGAGIQAVVRLF